MLKIGTCVIILLLGSVFIVGYIPFSRAESFDLLRDAEWTASYNAILYQNLSGMIIVSNTTDKQNLYRIESPIYDRAYTALSVPPIPEPNSLKIDYATINLKGEGEFVIEMRSEDKSKILWDANLGNTNGTLVSKVFPFTNQSGEFRFYIITSEPSYNILSIQNATIIPDNSPMRSIMPWLF